MNNKLMNINVIIILSLFSASANQTSPSCVHQSEAASWSHVVVETTPGVRVFTVWPLTFVWIRFYCNKIYFYCSTEYFIYTSAAVLSLFFNLTLPKSTNLLKTKFWKQWLSSSVASCWIIMDLHQDGDSLEPQQENPSQVRVNPVNTKLQDKQKPSFHDVQSAVMNDRALCTDVFKRRRSLEITVLTLRSWIFTLFPCSHFFGRGLSKVKVPQSTLQKNLQQIKLRLLLWWRLYWL